MSVLTPASSAPALPFVGLLMIVLALALAGRLIHARRAIRRALLRPCKLVARLAACLGSLRAAVVAATARDAAAALPVAVEVMAEDRGLRDRVLQHARIVLTRCTAIMGPPPANCAVLIARGLERDGRSVGGYVERLTCTDGTIRTIIALALGAGPDAPSFDTLAARLVGYYLVAINAERTVLSAETLPAPTNPVAALATRVPLPQPTGLRPLPTVAEVKRA